MLVFAKDGKITDPPVEIVEYCFLKELQGYTLETLDAAPCDWVLRQFTIMNALAEESANERKRAEAQAKAGRRR